MKEETPMTSPNLNLKSLNDTITDIDLALTDTVDIDLTSADATVADADFRENIVLRAANNAVARTLTVPAIKRLFVARNDGTASLTVACGTTNLSVSANEAGFYYTDGTANGLKEISGSTGGGSNTQFAAVHVEQTVDQSVPNAGTVGSSARSVFDTQHYQDKHNGYKLWLGLNLTFAVASIAEDTLTATTHDTITGDGPLFLTTLATLPSGLSAAVKYWVIRVDADTIKLATSFSNALAGTAVDVTDSGTGTHTLDRASRVVIPDSVTRVRVAAWNTWASNSNGGRHLHILKNDLLAPENSDQSGIPSASFTVLRLSTSSPVINVAGGDYLQVGNWQNSGGNLNVIQSGINVEIIK